VLSWLCVCHFWLCDVRLCTFSRSRATQVGVSTFTQAFRASVGALTYLARTLRFDPALHAYPLYGAATAHSPTTAVVLSKTAASAGPGTASAGSAGMSGKAVAAAALAILRVPAGGLSGRERGWGRAGERGARE